MAEQKTGVWIEWDDGECPVPYDTMVMAKLLIEEVHFEEKKHRAGSLYWRSDIGGARIVAYMIVPTYVPKPKPERWTIVKRTQPIGHGCVISYPTHYAINDRTSMKLGNLVATTCEEHALLQRFVKLLNEVAP